MTEKAQIILDLLTSRGIAFEIVKHDAVYTMDEMLRLNLPHADSIAKNLFLRDDKKHNYYLLVVREEKKVSLKSIKEKIGSRPLTFASESDLSAILKLAKGSVTPFGILHDEERKVRIILDEAFRGKLIGVHPNDNTATVWLSVADLVSILEQHGNSVDFAVL